jgi:hypothetical protein
MPNESSTRLILRPEARPLDLSRLNQSQSNAFLKILQAMDEARRDLDRAHRGESSPKRPAPPNLLQQSDPYRSSRLIFLSGERGTGKSTVLISMLQAFLNSQPAPASDQKKASAPDPKNKEEITDLLGGLKNRIIWLEPLDMEPLPRPTNLLAAILARIDSAASRFMAGAGESPRPAGLLNLSSGENALLKLKKLASDVAIAWDGNVEERGAALDPDSFAEEVNRVEQARLGINARLDESLDTLARELARTREVLNPFFVLPVDDYDLNPLRALDLLQLLRMVSSPRLFILVLGDVRTAEIVFNLKKSGEFATILRDAHSSDYLSLSAPEIGSLARTLSGHAIRKLVPPGQRLSLGRMEIHEALKFHPLLDESPEVPSTLESLGDLLQKLPVEIETAICAGEKQCIGGRDVSSFKEFLLFDLLAEKSGQAASPTSPYTGATLLKAAPRYIADLWFSLYELNLPAPKKPLENLIEYLGQEAHRAVEEDPLLSIRYRERFIDALGIGPDEGWLQAMKFIEARSVSVPGRLVPFREERCTLNAHFRRSWSFFDLGEDKPIDIGERAKALLILLHDLLALEREGGIIGSHALSPDSMDLDWAFASWDAGLSEEVKVPWITPSWTSFWEYEQFDNLWQAVKQGGIWSQDEKAQRAFLAYAWLAGVTLILCGRPTKSLKLSEIPEADLHEPAAEIWTELEEAIEGLVHEVSPRGRDSQEASPSSARADRIESWLIRLPVLLAPESGFMPGTLEILEEKAPHLFAKEEVQTFYDQRRISSKIRRLRADRLAPFIGTDLLEEFLRDDQIVNKYKGGIFRPDEAMREEARRRAIKKGTIGPKERIAAALEAIATNLGKDRPESAVASSRKPRKKTD